MKLKVNFISSAESRRKMLIYAGWLFLVMLICFSIFMAMDGFYMKGQRQIFLNRLDEKTKENAALKEPDTIPGYGAVAALKQKAAEINRLKISKSEGLSSLLFRIESLAPEGIYFTRFEYSLEDGSIQFQAAASNAQLIPVFISLMEKDSTFKAVTLEKQSLRESGTNASKVLFAVKAEEAK